MKHRVYVIVGSCSLAHRIDGKGACEWRVRDVECDDAAVGLSQEPMVATTLVTVIARDDPRWIDTGDGSACGTRGIERGYIAVTGADEAVAHNSVALGSRDPPSRINAGRISAADSACDIDDGKSATATPQIAVKTIRIAVKSCNLPRGIDAGRVGKSCSARWIENSHSAIVST